MKHFKEYEEVRKKCRSIVTYFSKSTTAREKFTNTQKSLDPTTTPLHLVQEVDIRWNSTYAMFKRLILLHTSLNVILSEEHMPDNLNSHEWKFIESLVNILEPIHDATVIMSGEIYSTISQYYPMYIALMHVLQDADSPENILCTDICNKVRNALKTRFEPIFEDDSIYIIAMLLDPRFKDQLLSPDKKYIIHNKFSLQISKVHDEPNSSNQENININSNTSGKTKSKLIDVFNKTLSNREGGAETFDNKKNSEIKIYLLKTMSRETPTS